VARLEHPHIVPVYAFGEYAEGPYLAMKYVEGGSLARRLREGEPWPARKAAALVADLAGAVEHAHRRGILHRDLKPGNVLLSAEGHAYLTDFGLARWLGGQDGLTRAGEALGTPAYMPPEQARGEVDRQGPAADVFGLGGILYRLLTGRPPYQGNSRAVLDQAGAGAIPPVRAVNPSVPRGLARVCEKALSAQPGRRHASAAALEHDLRRYLAGPRRRAFLAALAAPAAALLGLWLLGSRRGGPDREGGPAGLAGELTVRVWTPKDEKKWPLRKKGWQVQEPESLPVRNGEQVHIEARLSRPAHVYLLWVDGEGAVTPLYPWNRGQRIEVDDVGAPPPAVGAREVVHSPAAVDRGWPVEGPSGLETVLLLAREEPLPAGVKLKGVLGRLAPAPLADPHEAVLRGLDRGQGLLPLAGQYRRPAKQAQVIDDSLVQLLGRLEPHFALIRAVRFAKSDRAEP
jgi:hypothetical protein